MAAHGAVSRRSQSGGPGKATGRSMTRTMQRRNTFPARYCWQRRALWVATRSQHEEAWYRGPHTTGRGRGPTGVGSTARRDSARGKVGKVSRVAEALPHSEGAGYKRQNREIPACRRDRRMGSEYAMMDRDNRTRTGAKDPWGREVMGLPDSGSRKHGRVRTLSRISTSCGSGRRVDANRARRRACREQA